MRSWESVRPRADRRRGWPGSHRPSQGRVERERVSPRSRSRRLGFLPDPVTAVTCARSRRRLSGQPSIKSRHDRTRPTRPPRQNPCNAGTVHTRQREFSAWTGTAGATLRAGPTRPRGPRPLPGKRAPRHRRPLPSTPGHRQLPGSWRRRRLPGGVAALSRGRRIDSGAAEAAQGRAGSLLILSGATPRRQGQSAAHASR
jgi:hypothetical protein